MWSLLRSVPGLQVGAALLQPRLRGGQLCLQAATPPISLQSLTARTVQCSAVQCRNGLLMALSTGEGKSGQPPVIPLSLRASIKAAIACWRP